MRFWRFVRITRPMFITSSWEENAEFNVIAEEIQGVKYLRATNNGAYRNSRTWPAATADSSSPSTEACAPHPTPTHMLPHALAVFQLQLWYSVEILKGSARSPSLLCSIRQWFRPNIWCDSFLKNFVSIFLLCQHLIPRSHNYLIFIVLFVCSVSNQIK